MHQTHIKREQQLASLCSCEGLSLQVYKTNTGKMVTGTLPLCKIAITTVINFANPTALKAVHMEKAMAEH